MTHSELRALLPAYAEGTLTVPEVAAVRAHLATGCEECLRTVFDRPVGLPRRNLVRSRSAFAPLVVVGGAAGMGAALGALLVGRIFGGGPPEPADSTPRWPQEIAAMQSRSETSIAEIRHTLARMEATLTAPAGRCSPEADVGTAPAGGAPFWLEEVLAGSGGRVELLRPLAPGSAGQGVAVWSPGGSAVGVHVGGLAPAPSTYRVRIDLADGSTVWRGDLAPAMGGTISATVALPAGAARVRGVALYGDLPGAPLSSARFSR